MFRTSTRLRYAPALVLLTAVAFVACGDDDAMQPDGDGDGAEPAALAFVTQPTDATAGMANIVPAGATALQGGSGQITASVEIQDASGDRVTDATNAVTLAIGDNPGGGTLTGETTVNAVNGVANFSVQIDRTGTAYTLNASSSGLTGAASSAFNITAAAPAQLAFSTLPGDNAAQVAFSPIEIEIRDEFDNFDPTATNTVTMAIGTNPAGGTLSGTTTVDAVAGVASFDDLSINNLGSGYTLDASSTGLTGASSPAFDITAGPPAQLVFRTQPSDATVRTAIAPPIEVEVQDQFGNLATTAALDVTLNIQTNAGIMLLNASGFATPTLNRVDPVTLTVLPALPAAVAPGNEVFGMTYWQPTNRVLAAVTDFNPATALSNLFSIDPATGAPTLIGTIGDAATGPFVRPLAVESATGRLLAGDRFGNLLCVIDPATAAATVLGPVLITGDAIVLFNGLAEDPTTGTLWGVVILNSTAGADPKIRTLVTINVSALTATIVGTLSELGTSSITFLPDGTLLATTGRGARGGVPNPEQLWTVDKTTAAMTSILALPSNDGGQVITQVPAIISGNVETAANGVATFSNAAIDGVGNGYVLEAISGALTTVLSTMFNITP